MMFLFSLVCAKFSPSELGACQPALDTFKHCPLPTAAPTVMPSSDKPTLTPSPLPICQFGGFCRSDWNCYAGNKCNVQSAYYSQCIANPAT